MSFAPGAPHRTARPRWQPTTPHPADVRAVRGADMVLIVTPWQANLRISKAEALRQLASHGPFMRAVTTEGSRGGDPFIIVELVKRPGLAHIDADLIDDDR